MSVLPPIEMVSAAGSNDRSIASVVAAVLAPDATMDIDAPTAPTKAALSSEPRLRLSGFEPDLDPQTPTSALGGDEKFSKVITTLNQVHIMTAAFGAVVTMVQQIPESFKRLMQG